MDFGTIIGCIFALVAVLMAIQPQNLAQFIDPEGIIIIFGGGLCVLLISFPLRSLLGLPRVIGKAMRTADQRLPEVIETMVAFATVARRDGLLALEERLRGLEDPFLLRGIQMTIDGVPPESVRAILNTDVDQMAVRHQVGKGIVEYAGAAAPALGMCATLIGLVRMLNNLSDPSSLGPAMSVALTATFYGAILANFICIPLGNKLHDRNVDELLARQLMIEGILAIQSGENPNVIRERLLSFLPPPERAQVEKRSR
jgi:chemotaxis protein MotA